MVDGVCGGLAEFFGVDVTLVRISWVLLTLLGGSGIILYLVAMLVMPKNPAPVAALAQPRSAGANAKFWGILLVIVGVLWLLRNLDIPYYLHWWGFSWEYAMPVVLILAGVAFLFGGRSGMMNSPVEQPVNPTDQPTGTEANPGEPVPPVQSVPAATRLFRSHTERKVFGVCGGIGVYLNIDPTIIRILFIVGTLASFGFMLLLYIAMAIIIPNEPYQVPTVSVS
jgi:phage shock protein C